MEIDFHSKLAQYVKDKDNENATNVVIQELAVALMQDRENFIEVLRGAGLNVEDDATDLQLINTFIDNAPSNRKLLLGASYLVNHRNQSVNFDGENEVSDISVKNSFKAMDDYFSADGDEEKSNFLPFLAPLIKGGLKMARNKMGQNQDNSNQQNARQKMIAELNAQKKREADRKAKEEAEKKKTRKTLIIVGSSILGLVIIGAIIYAVKKR
jgi:hypothetical protein